MKKCGYHPGYCLAPIGCPAAAGSLSEVLDRRQMYMEADVCVHRANQGITKPRRSGVRTRRRRRKIFYKNRLL